MYTTIVLNSKFRIKNRAIYIVPSPSPLIYTLTLGTSPAHTHIPLSVDNRRFSGATKSNSNAPPEKVVCVAADVSQKTKNKQKKVVVSDYQYFKMEEKKNGL